MGRAGWLVWRGMDAPPTRMLIGLVQPPALPERAFFLLFLHFFRASGTIRRSMPAPEIPVTDDTDLRTRLNRETARIHWQELQPHFARGTTVFVAPGLDLIEVACQFAEDNVAEIQRLMTRQDVGRVTEAQASEWAAVNQEMWAVVVAPWVLLQPHQTH